MSALSEKIRRARERRVPVKRHVFIVRRPTDIEMMRLALAQDLYEFLPFVVGWEQVTEEDVLPGSAPTPLTFDPDACREWLADRPDLLTPIIDDIRAAFKEHQAAVEAAGKN